MLDDLIKKAERTHALTQAECAALLVSGLTDDLAAAADRVRREYVGDAVHLRGLIEFSNICRRGCAYCGLRRENAALHRYRLSAEEIIGTAKAARAAGYETIVLQSGEDPFFTAERLAHIIREIKKLGVAITLSVGERPYEDYALWRETGADRYLLRLETTDRALYERLDPGMSHEERRRCLRDLRALGYEVGTGSLIGLGESYETLAQDLLFYQEIDADMLGFGPLIPNGDTPLGSYSAGDLALTRRVVALARLLMPEINLPATTAVETLQRGARELFLKSGANVLMPALTEGRARLDYALYPGKACADESPAKCRPCLEGRLKAIGRTIGKGQGGRKNFKH